MPRHKLDDATEEILQHYGIKGMKWDVIRTDEQIAAANGKSQSEAAGGGEGIEDVEGFLDEFGDTVGKVVDVIGETLGDVGDSVKKNGMKLLTSIFGKSKVKIGKATPNKKNTELIKKGMKEYDRANPTQKKLLKKGYRSSTVTSTVKVKPVSRTTSKSNDDSSTKGLMENRVARSKKNNAANDIRRAREASQKKG